MGLTGQWHRVPLQYCRGTGSHLFILLRTWRQKKKDDSSHLQKMLGSPKIQQILKDQLQTLPSATRKNNWHFRIATEVHLRRFQKWN